MSLLAEREHCISLFPPDFRCSRTYAADSPSLHVCYAVYTIIFILSLFTACVFHCFSCYNNKRGLSTVFVIFYGKRSSAHHFIASTIINHSLPRIQRYKLHLLWKWKELSFCIISFCERSELSLRSRIYKIYVVFLFPS